MLFTPRNHPFTSSIYPEYREQALCEFNMAYLQQKDSTWQTRRPSSPFTRYTRSHRRQLFVVLALLCMLVYWTVCVGIDANKNLFTPPLPATPNFFAGASEDRLVTVQSSPLEALSVAPSEHVDADYPSTAPLKLLDNVKPDTAQSEHVAEQISDSQSAAVQVIKGSSIHDIGDIEEQQSSAEDAFELQPVVADGGRLTESSKTQTLDRLDSLGGSASDRGSDSEDLTHPLPFSNGLETSSHSVNPATAISRYTFPDTSNFERLNRMADELPDFVHIPLHMAVSDEVLEGWEEDWFARAEYNAIRHGRVREPKIDFVYTCKCLFAHIICSQEADI